jgi:hypothetical protein
MKLLKLFWLPLAATAVAIIRLLVMPHIPTTVNSPDPVADAKIDAEATNEEKITAATSDPDPTGLGQSTLGEIYSYLNGGNIPPVHAIILTGGLASEVGNDFTPAALRNAVKNVQLAKVENGQAIWKGRDLPAAIATVTINTVNRSAGTYGEFCIRHAAINDDEFKMLRNDLYTYCEEGDTKLAEWRKLVSYSANSISH